MPKYCERWLGGERVGSVTSGYFNLEVQCGLPRPCKIHERKATDMALVNCVVEYIQVELSKKKPWLIVGKGPTMDSKFDTSRFHVLTLNHAALVHRPTIAHFTDWEAYMDCAESMRELVTKHIKTALCLPWHPHVKCKPTKDTVLNLLQGDYSRIWISVGDRGRLLAYNSTVASKLPENPRLRTIRVRYFSAVAAFNILAEAGVKKIFTLGVDGGKEYARGLDPKHKLANGRDSFDIQFKEIEATVKKHNIEWRKL